MIPRCRICIISQKLLLEILTQWVTQPPALSLDSRVVPLYNAVPAQACVVQMQDETGLGPVKPIPIQPQNSVGPTRQALIIWGPNIWPTMRKSLTWIQNFAVFYATMRRSFCSYQLKEKGPNGLSSNQIGCQLYNTVCQ